LSGHHIGEGNRRNSPCAVCNDIPLLLQAVMSLWHVLLSAVGLGIVCPSSSTLWCCKCN